MQSYQAVVITLCSTTVRLTAYIFLRWIPAHLAFPVIVTALLLYLSSIWVVSCAQGSGKLNQTGKESVKKTSKNDGSKETATRKGSNVYISPLKSLLTGIPCSSSKLITFITVGLNILLTLFAIDFVFRGVLLFPTAALSFSRVGYVSPDTAKILIREPDPQKLPLRISYKEVTDGNEEKWTELGTVYSLSEMTDYTFPVTLKNLQPSKKYRYIVSNNLTGEFTTAPVPGSPDSSRLTFWTSSCIKPNFPYSLFSHPLRIPGIETMAQVNSELQAQSQPSFMLFLGDFIYIDVPLRFGSSVASYRNEYRRVYSSPSWNKEPSPSINLPWIHMLDDHEIANDWHEGNATAPYPAAVDPYLHYHVSVNPPIPDPSYAIPSNTTYFSFTNGPASFFILDTRNYRSEPSHENSTILGSAQLRSLLYYISRPEPNGVKWKIISSSVPFTKNWHIGTEDTWGGFLFERQSVLETIRNAERELGVRVVLLSGDRHEFGATRFPDPTISSTDSAPPSGAGPGIHEFCAGPLSQFYLPIRSYYQEGDEDVNIKYIPTGNYKFGAISIENDADGGSHFIYSLYVDGKVVWKYKLSVPSTTKSGETFPGGEVLFDEQETWESYIRKTATDLTEFAHLGNDWARNVMDKGRKLFLKSERIDE